MNTCRICKGTNYDGHEPLFKYGVRHYAHASCGLTRWGSKFLTMIPRHMVGQIPFVVLLRYEDHIQAIARNMVRHDMAENPTHPLEEVSE